jgi:hypothetical protein
LGNNSCADTDPATGKPLYTVCKDRGKALFWDNKHPTMSAWHYIINLYATTPGFILLADAPTLLDWFRNDAAIQAVPVAPPIPQPGASCMINNVNSTKISMKIYEEISCLQVMRDLWHVRMGKLMSIVH